MGQRGQLIDITNQKFNKLLVISRVKNDKDNRAQWLCKCDCGNEIIVSGKKLRSGHTKSCGCIRDYDLTGQKFGKLFLLEKVITKNWSEQRMAYRCKCDCGKEKIVSAIALHNGTKSCGCYKKEHIKDLKLAFGESAFNTVYRGYKNGASKRKLKFLLTPEECKVLFKQNCHYCGIEPTNKCKNTCGNGTYIYNGIDRVNTKLGYTKDNVVSCCKFCNFAKGRWELSEFLNWIERIKSHA